MKSVREDWGTTYPFNSFTNNSGVFHNETKWANFLTMRDQKYDFHKFFKKFFIGVNYPKIIYHYTKNGQTGVNSAKNLEKIYVVCEN